MFTRGRKYTAHLQNWDEFWLDELDFSLSGLLEVFFLGNLNWNMATNHTQFAGFNHGDLCW